jgi:biotin carboxyl carrier protein
MQDAPKMDKKEEFSTLYINSTLYKTRLSRKFLNRKKYHPVDSDMVTSFIPGTILDVFVTEGQEVKKGQELLILDAMKMQNRLKSSCDGHIRKIHVTKGSRVSKGDLLIELQAAASEES